MAEIRRVRGEGVPLIGITWWGLIDQVDWNSGLRRLDHHIDATGLYDLRWEGERLARVPNSALTAWRRYTERPSADTVGPLAVVPWGDRDVAPLW